MSHHKLDVSEPVKLDLVLGMFQWALNSPLMGMAEHSLQKGQLLQEHQSTRSVHVNIALHLYDVVDPLGHFRQGSSC